MSELMESFYEIGVPKFVKFNNAKFLINTKSNEFQFREACENIMNNKSVNVLYFDRILAQILTTDCNPFSICNDIFNTHTKNISDEIYKKINDDTFTNKYFIDTYNNYVKGSITLKKLFLKLNKYCVSDDNKKNTLYILSNYYFYKNVLEKKYSMKYLHTFLKMNDNNLSDIINIVKIYGFYSNFVKQINKGKFTNLDNTCVTLEKINEDILKIVLEEIDKNIREFKNTYKNTDNIKDLEQIISSTVNTVKTFSQLDNNIDFIINYRDRLQQRLLDNCNFKIENKLLNSIPFNCDKDIYLTMKLIIDDIIQSETIDTIVKNNVQLNFTSEKYKNMKFNDVNVSVKVLSEEIWKNKNLKQNSSIKNFNTQLNLYTDIYTKLFGVIFNNKKTFDVNYTLSKVNFNYGINNKVYKIKSNMYHCILLTEINNNSDGITSDLLKRNLNINLADVGAEINSLVKIKLINKISDNNNFKFTINKDFNYSNENIDLLHETNEIIKFMELRKSFNSTECKTIIYELFSKNKNTKYSIKNICDYVLSKNIAAYSNEVSQYIEDLVNTSIILKTDDMYYLNENQKNEFDSEEEEEEEVEVIEIIEEVEVEEGEEGEEIVYEEVEVTDDEQEEIEETEETETNVVEKVKIEEDEDCEDCEDCKNDKTITSESESEDESESDDTNEIDESDEELKLQLQMIKEMEDKEKVKNDQNDNQTESETETESEDNSEDEELKAQVQLIKEMEEKEKVKTEEDEELKAQLQLIKEMEEKEKVKTEEDEELKAQVQLIKEMEEKEKVKTEQDEVIDEFIISEDENETSHTIQVQEQIQETQKEQIQETQHVLKNEPEDLTPIKKPKFIQLGKINNKVSLINRQENSNKIKLLPKNTDNSKYKQIRKLEN